MALMDEFVAPEGWHWTGGRTLALSWGLSNVVFSKENDKYQESINSLKNFLEENNLKSLQGDRLAFPIQIEHAPEMRYIPYVYYSWALYKESEWRYGPDEHWKDKDFKCGFCGHDEKTSSLFCHECGTFFWCTSCNRARKAAHYDVTSGLTHCDHCGIACSCGKFHGGYMSRCPECEPVVRCSRCSSWVTELFTIVKNDSNSEQCCQHCVSTYCNGCESFTDETLEPNEENRRICRRCEFLGEDGDNEIFDDTDMQATKLSLPTIAGREMIRLSGVEIEGGLGKLLHHPVTGANGPNHLARALYENQLSATYQQQGYHHGRGFARVETDASCDWECVIGPINMADVEHVRKLNRVLKLIKQQIKDDMLKLDLRCGTHIHVSAERVAIGNAFNLHLIYTYMEDVLYRLGAAHWPIHRILINDESHSAARSPKEMTKTKFARKFHGNRYYGLSFNNYFERMLSHCQCGAARYGSFEECTCDLQKCTFEFRLFNSTANTIKLHAYLALCQALVAKAISMPEIKDASVFEAFPFEMSRFRDMSASKQREMIGKWDERLRYIANDLPLTDEEKKSIYYCIKNSELSKVDSAKELFKGDN